MASAQSCDVGCAGCSYSCVYFYSGYYGTYGDNSCYSCDGGFTDIRALLGSTWTSQNCEGGTLCVNSANP